MTTIPFKQNPDQSDAPESNDALALRLLRQGKIRAALDRAKSVHKARPTPQSETFLLQCYAAREREMRAAGRAAEADALCAFVAENFPGSDLARVGNPIAASPKVTTPTPIAAPTAETARQGPSENDPLAAALTRLSDPGISEDARRAAEETVAEAAFNPLALAEHPALSPGHPLAAAAKAVAEAFSAVVQRPVADAEIALPEISRRSPLAGWKLLIRAIAHLQRREDEQAATALERLAAMPSAPARLVPELRLILANQAEKLDGEFRRIFAPWRPREKRLPAALARVDAALSWFLPKVVLDYREAKKARKMEKELCAALHSAAEAIRLEAPSLGEAFRGSVVPKALMFTNVPLPELEKAAGGAAVRSAAFWRLAALAMEERLGRWQGSDSLGDLCAAWDGYRRHGIAEGLFPGGGPEEAEIYRHLAETLMDFQAYRWDGFALKANNFGADYCYGPEQPEAVRALKPDAKAKPLPPDPAYLFGEAARLAPTSAIFRTWLDAARHLEKFGAMGLGGPIGKNFSKNVPSEKVIEAWSLALPNDPAPWLLLMKEAEDRDALSLAQKHLARAEAIDPLNADLKRGKWRLVLAVCRKHLKQGKAHLVMADLGELKELKRFGPDHTDWLLEAIRWVIVSHLTAEAEKCHARLVEMIGGGEAGKAAAALLESGLLILAHQSLYPKTFSSPPLPPQKEAAQVLPAIIAVTRLLQLSGTIFGWTKKSKWPEWIAKALELVPEKDLPFLAETMLPSGHYEILFKLTARVLAKTAKTNHTGQALYLRSCALRSSKTYQLLRIQQCLRAAAEIARRSDDRATLDAVTAVVQKEGESLRYFSDPRATLAPMSDNQINEVIKIERKNAAFPSGRGIDPYLDSIFDQPFDDDADEDLDDDFDDDFEESDWEELCPCPECRRKRGERVAGGRGGAADSGLPRELKKLLETTTGVFSQEYLDLLRGFGLSKHGARIIAEIITPVLVMRTIMGKGIGNGFFEFLHMEPDTRDKVMEALPKLSAEDRRLIEEGDIREQFASVHRSLKAGPKRGKKR